MIESTPTNPQTPSTPLTTPRRKKTQTGFILGILAICFLCFATLTFLGSGTVAWDSAIGTELDSNGHVLENNVAIPADTPEIYLGFNFFGLSSAPVSLQICWFRKKQLLYCDQQSYKNGYVLASLRPDLYQQDDFAAGDYFVLVYDLIIVEDHVMLGENFIVSKLP